MVVATSARLFCSVLAGEEILTGKVISPAMRYSIA